MYWVYLISSIAFPEQKYVGFTEDVKKRLSTHNAKGSTHTAQHAPWELQACFAFQDKQRALDFEKYLKSHSGRAFSSKHFW